MSVPKPLNNSLKKTAKSGNELAKPPPNHLILISMNVVKGSFTNCNSVKQLVNVICGILMGQAFA